MRGDGGSADHLVHGMSLEPAEPDWPPLTEDEVRAVLTRSGLPDSDVAIEWHSPRPFSAAAIVRHGGAGVCVVKRHHRAVRNATSLADEHDFERWLGHRDQPVPEPLAPPFEEGEYAYEVLGTVPGADRYQDALSWTPFQSTGDARAAGRALARMHLAAEDYGTAARAPAPLLATQQIIVSDDPLGEIGRLAESMPGLGDYLGSRPWRREIGDMLLPMQRPAREHLSGIEPLFTHNDWHGSNLFWSPELTAEGSEVTGIIDFGLCNLTSAVYDLATAVERSCIEWLQPSEARPVHVDQLHALLDGYRSVRRLTAAEAAALPHVLPVVHVEYALSEIEYFHGIVGSAVNADLAYEEFLLGHLGWFATADGNMVLQAVASALDS